MNKHNWDDPYKKERDTGEGSSSVGLDDLLNAFSKGSKAGQDLLDALRPVVQSVIEEIKDNVSNVQKPRPSPGKEAPEEVVVTVQTEPETPETWTWDAAQVYIVDGKVATGMVPFDDRISYTKMYDTQAKQLLTLGSLPLAEIRQRRIATEGEKALLTPPPTTEEALAILRAASSDPVFLRALDVVENDLHREKS